MTPRRHIELDARLAAIQGEMEALTEELKRDHAPDGSSHSLTDSTLNVVSGIKNLRWLLERRREGDEIGERIKQAMERRK